MPKMKHLLRKLHIGGGCNIGNHHPSPPQTAEVMPLSSSSSASLESALMRIRAVESAENSVDFNFFEEEFQIKDAKQISLGCECFLDYLGCLLEDDSSWCNDADSDPIHPSKSVDYKLAHLSDEVFDSHILITPAFVQKLFAEASTDSARCPYLANLEIERRKFLFGKGDDDKLIEALMQYFFSGNLTGMLSNRELARHSRRRKQAHLTELETQVFNKKLLSNNVNLKEVPMDHTNSKIGTDAPPSSTPNWTINISDVRTVKVSNISLATSAKDIKEFFSFSGDIQYVEMQRSALLTYPLAYVTFKESQGADTAMLLTGSTIADLSVICYRKVPSEEQIKDLLRKKNFEEAISLVEELQSEGEMTEEMLSFVHAQVDEAISAIDPKKVEILQRYLQWLIEDQDSEDSQVHTTYALLLAKSTFETESTSQNSEAGNLEETNMSMFQSPIRERLHINFR
ncbi:unnamed protein product [Camellia sinensis]